MQGSGPPRERGVGGAVREVPYASCAAPFSGCAGGFPVRACSLSTGWSTRWSRPCRWKRAVSEPLLDLAGFHDLADGGIGFRIHLDEIEARILRTVQRVARRHDSEHDAVR